MPASSRNSIEALTLRAIALSRSPGFNWPGWFLRVAFDRAEGGRSRLTLDTAPENVEADGQMGAGPFALLCDVGLAVSFRGAIAPSMRLATASLAITYTGVPRTGRLVATSKFEGFFASGNRRLGLARGEVRSGRERVALLEGSFMTLGDLGPMPLPLPRRGEARDATIAEAELDEREREVLAHARACEARRDVPFIRGFWGYLPERTAEGATCRAWNGPHVGNRVGHAQGGFSFALGQVTAEAAAPEDWRVASASAWYIGPGLGRFLTARSTVLHRGMQTCIVRTRIEDEEGRGVLETVTQHVRG